MKTAEEQVREIIDLLDEERILKGYTRKQTAKLAGSSLECWSNFSHGHHSPTAITLISFANALGLRLKLVPLEEAQDSHAG